MKDKVLRILPGLVFLAVFNVMFFVVTGPERSAALWTSYGFVHLSFILMLLCPLAAGRGKNAYLHTGTTTVIAAVYFLLALGWEFCTALSRWALKPCFWFISCFLRRS